MRLKGSVGVSPGAWEEGKQVPQQGQRCWGGGGEPPGWLDWGRRGTEREEEVRGARGPLSCCEGLAFSQRGGRHWGALRTVVLSLC